jgi:bifunctional enzyme CysN/CysC
MDLLRFTTAGSVDDGKSTLIGRLLFESNALYDDHIAALRNLTRGDADTLDFSLITDGLKAEREQGITIDVAYRYFSTPRRRFIIADTPGHEQYTRNMATGASTADVAVVLIDACLGVLTQSKRHSFIASLLGVPHLVVAINKMDLMDFQEDVFTRIRKEYLDFLAPLGYPDVTFIPISALQGDNVVTRSERMPWYTGGPLLSYLENVCVREDQNLIDFRFHVQRVVRAPGFRGYSGQIQSGVVRVDDEIVIAASGRRSRISRIVTCDRDIDTAIPPMSVTLCLADDIDISRGDLLSHPDTVPRAERSLDAMMIWMCDQRLEPGRKYLIKHGTNTVQSSCAEVVYAVDPDTLHHTDATALGLNDIGRARFTLFRPLFVDDYHRNRANGSFIVIDPVTNATAGAGMVSDRRQPAHAASKDVQRDISWQAGLVSQSTRDRLLKQEPATIWLTGLSVSGKSTLAFEVERRLLNSGHACFVLDGDNVRHGLNRDLGFSPNDRSENIRRVAEVAHLFNQAGLIVMVAFISPYARDREIAREIIGHERFVEVYLSADVAACEARDQRGLYARARSGQIPEFTGVTAPYEVPVNPSLTLDTASRGIDECVADILVLLESRLNETP